MRPAEVVLDASVAVRGLVGGSEAANQVVDAVLAGETSAYAPDLIVAEVTNALRARVDAAGWSRGDARDALDVFLAWPLTVLPCAKTAPAALEIAVARDLTAYDAFYAALAAALEAPLLTADRRLAEAVPGSMLVQ